MEAPLLIMMAVILVTGLVLVVIRVALDSLHRFSPQKGNCLSRHPSNRGSHAKGTQR